MANPLDLEPELIPFANPKERELLADPGALLEPNRQAALVELRCAREAWLATLNPTREQILAVAHQGDRDHVASSDGNEQHWKALEADWYRKQKPTAEDVLNARNSTPAQSAPPVDPIGREKPIKKGVDLSELVKRVEAAEKENPPTAEELSKRRKRLEEIAASLGLLDVRPPDFSSLVDSLKRDEEESRKRVPDFAKPPDRQILNDALPPMVDWAKAESDRRRADADANARAMERAMDNALKKAEDRARTQRGLEDFGTRLGYPQPTPPEPKKETTQGEKLFLVLTGLGDVLLAMIGGTQSKSWVSLVILVVACVIQIAVIFKIRPWRAYKWNVALAIGVVSVLTLVWWGSRPEPPASTNQETPRSVVIAPVVETKGIHVSRDTEVPFQPGQPIGINFVLAITGSPENVHSHRRARFVPIAVAEAAER